jgi:cytochrome c oxidase assembly factor CtaG
MKTRPALFVLGMIVVLAAVLSPLDVESAEHFPAHMIQHMILVLVAGPLLAGSRMADPRLRVLRSILVVGALHAFALWVWHLPALYDAAMENTLLHMLEHVVFLITAVLFWNVVFDVQVDRLKRVALVFGTMLQSGALGVVIAFAAEPLYRWHIEHTPSGPLGTSAVLSEQQAAGAIMWIPPGVVYIAVMLGLLAKALSAFEAAEQQ